MKALPILIVILILTTAFGAYFVYYEITGVSTSSTTTSVIPYSADAEYTYQAALAPNILYNSTTLSYGQGTLFSNLTKSIVVVFRYTVRTENISNINLTGTYSEVLMGSSWNKTLLTINFEQENSSVTSSSLTSNFTIDMASISKLVGTIEGETGITESTYTISFVPQITGRIDSNGVSGVISDNPAFNFTISSSFGSRAGIIVPSSPDASISGELRGPLLSVDSPPSLLYYISFITLGASVAALISITLLYDKRSKLSASQNDILERKLSQYREIISRTVTPPKEKGLVYVESMEDLLKIADTMGKPVLRFEKKGELQTQQFYVLDGSICYLFSLAGNGAVQEQGTHETGQSPSA